MQRALRVAAWLLFLFALIVAGAMLAVQGRGVSARPQPSSVETRAALFLRGWLTPPTYKGLRNPVTATAENFAAARQHFAANMIASPHQFSTGVSSLFPQSDQEPG